LHWEDGRYRASEGGVTLNTIARKKRPLLRDEVVNLRKKVLADSSVKSHPLCRNSTHGRWKRFK